MESPVVFGEKYRDKITGFTGTATGRAMYMHDKAQALLEGQVTGDRPKPSTLWIDEERLEEVTQDF